MYKILTTVYFVYVGNVTIEEIADKRAGLKSEFSLGGILVIRCNYQY